MRAIIIGQEYRIDHPMGQGHWWMLETLYLNSLMHDPFVLASTGRAPMVVLPGSIPADDQPSLLIEAHPTADGEAPAIEHIIGAGGAAVLIRPPAGLLGRIPALSWAARTASAAPVESLRERWDLGTGRTWYYTDAERYDRHDPACGQVLSWIGEHPDLIVRDRTALFAGNPWPTIIRYRNTPQFARLLLDVAEVLARLAAAVARRQVSAGERALMEQHAELRRDFHAFGFAAFTVEQLEKCLGVSRIDLGEPRATVVRAARTLAGGEIEEARSLLLAAFGLLERENRKLQPQPAIFTDTLHGGGLFEDIGYCEFDWPQHAADVLHNHLDWAERRSYRFNIDIAAKSLDHMSRRFPRLLERLRAAQEQGRAEVVNGTWNQPYPPFFTLESIIRQFDLGVEKLREMLGRPPVSFASQEFGFAPQLAAVLARYGYRQAVLRVQNMGDAPTVGRGLVRWMGPGGEPVLALPSHPYKSEQRNEVTYNNLHLKLFAAAAAGNPVPVVFTGLGDLTYYRPFREELARTAHYAEVFGRFSTWSGYFASQSASGSPPLLRTTMEDFDCRAGFLELSLWPGLRSTAGGHIHHCMRSLAASELFRAAELLDVIVGGEEAADAARQDARWQALAAYQGHDRYLAPGFPSGGFMGGANDPASLAGRTAQTVSDYAGPWDATTISRRADADLSSAEIEASAHIDQRLAEMAGAGAEPGEPAWLLFNPGSAGSRIVRLAKSAGRALLLDGVELPAQDDGDDRLAAIRAAACSCLVIRSAPAPVHPVTIPHPVRCGDGYLDNGLLRVEFDPGSGIIQRLVDKAAGADRLLLAGANRFHSPDGPEQRCLKLEQRQAGPLIASVEMHLAVGMPDGQVCHCRSWLSLEAGQPWLDLRQSIDDCPPIRGDQWQTHLALQFDLPDDAFRVQRSHFNVLEESRSQRIFSPNLLVAEWDSARLVLLNRGNQFYVRDGRSIRAILICENEWARDFSHRVGCPAGNVLAEARAWVAPWFIRRLAGGAPAGAGRAAVEIGSPEVELLSLTRRGNGLRMRLANLRGEETLASIRVAQPLAAAWEAGLNGQRIRRLELQDQRFQVTLRPWDLVQVELDLAPAAR